MLARLELGWKSSESADEAGAIGGRGSSDKDGEGFLK